MGSSPVKFILMLILFGLFTKLVGQSALPNNKINGVSFVSPSKPCEKELVELPSKIINANWICYMPYAFIKEGENQLIFNSEWQWWGEKEEGIQQLIQDAQSFSYRIMLKPQIWKSHGAFTGHHKYDDPKDWEKFEASYTEFLLIYARLAEKHKVDLLCIGTEWEHFIINRPDYWHKLIQQIREVYSGKLTYASNWDEYQRTPFWKSLDFIGVDAYFPLTQETTPNCETLLKAWEKPKQRLLHFSDSLGLPILFTEYGYRNRDQCAHQPWESDRGGNPNPQGQINAYEALFQSFWSEKNFAGGFLWKWFPNYDEVGGDSHTGFTPQKKPVEKIISLQYSKP